MVIGEHSDTTIKKFKQYDANLYTIAFCIPYFKSSCYMDQEFEASYVLLGMDYTLLSLPSGKKKGKKFMI